jgi:hypothetical protein
MRLSLQEKKQAYFKLKLLNAWEYKRQQLQHWKMPWRLESIFPA